MGRTYAMPLPAVTITTGDSTVDWIELGTSSAKRAALHMISLTTNASAEQFVDLRLVTRSTAGSSGTGITEVALDGGNTIASTITGFYLRTTQGTLTDTLLTWQWSMRGEFLFIPTPELRPVVSESKWLCLACGTSVTGTILLSGFALVEEF